jgi:arsenate reductase
MKKVLFVCTNNSARSQMAEGLLRYHAGDRFEAFSAGTEPGSVHPLAVRAMADVGIDITSQSSKSVDRFLAQPFDFVITVCDQVRETCPVFPGPAEQLHWSIRDPATVQGSEHDKLDAFRRVSKQIAARIGRFVLDQAAA